MNRSTFIGLAMFFAALVCCNALFAQDEVTILQGFDMNGCSKKLFSVSATKKVHFSRGNLQYNAAQDKWRFAPRQYSTVCNGNENIASDYDGWIDLFRWGTSGWSGSGAVAYQPWSTSWTSTDYIPGGDGTNNLTGDYANADWGVYNRISNGGNGKGMWRTPEREEWRYLLCIGSSNATRRDKNGLATIGGVYTGLVILPDEWTLPAGLSFTPGKTNGFATNKYDINQWQKMESAGAVFLPTGGCWELDELKPSNTGGKYWSATAYGSQDNTKAGTLRFEYNVLGNISYDVASPNRGNGYSVRLVRDSRESRGEAFDEDGASYKEFSVSATSTVRFSKGNLQYNAVKNIWRFAGKQYICIGEGNMNIAEDYNGWIDLFGWGTSGWSSGATAYQPWSTSETETDYIPGGSGTNNLTGEYANADWGVYNRINNGGNKTNQWRTLTSDEWSYLINETENATRSGKYGLATINGTSKSYKGMVLLPDDWTLPNGVTFTAGADDGFNTNTYTMAQWEKMESAGAIFFPAVGFREGTGVGYVGVNGAYWSTTYLDENRSWSLTFDNSGVGMGYGVCSGGFAVRLVK